MKKKEVRAEDLINWWLEKYHNTNLDRVQEAHPEWMDNPKEHSMDFYKAYAVTEQQHDEWNKWAKEYTRKVTGHTKKFIDRGWPWVYLDTSPSIIQPETKNENQ